MSGHGWPKQMPEAFGRREEKRLVCAFRNLKLLLKSQERLSNNQLVRQPESLFHQKNVGWHTSY
jgi:hypothetical protein